MCISMIVSVRWPLAPPVPSFLRSSADRSLRESLPTTRYVVPGWSSGRSPPGNASTLETCWNAKIGTATRNSTQSSSSARIHRNGRFGRRSHERGPRGLPPPAPPVCRGGAAGGGGWR